MSSTSFPCWPWQEPGPGHHDYQDARDSLKETDRIAAVAENLRLMGVPVTEQRMA